MKSDCVNSGQIMTDVEIVCCLLDVLDFCPVRATLLNAERLEHEFLIHGFSNLSVSNDGGPGKFTVRGSVGKSRCSSTAELIIAVSKMALALRLPALARESLYSLYADGHFRVIVTVPQGHVTYRMVAPD